MKTEGRGNKKWTVEEKERKGESITHSYRWIEDEIDDYLVY